MPSANNTQPWRFVVARRGTELFDQIFAALRPGNQPRTRRPLDELVLSTPAALERLSA